MKKKLGISYNNDKLNRYRPILESFQDYLTEELHTKFGRKFRVSYLEGRNDLIVYVNSLEQMSIRLMLSELHLLRNKAHWERLKNAFIEAYEKKPPTYPQTR